MRAQVEGRALAVPQPTALAVPQPTALAVPQPTALASCGGPSRLL